MNQENPNESKGITPIRIQKGHSMFRWEFVNDGLSPLRLRMAGIPVLASMRGRQPQKGENKYDFNKTINIDLTTQELSTLAYQFDLFLAGRLPAFKTAAKSAQMDTNIIHDTSKHAQSDNNVMKCVEFDHETNCKAWLRIKWRQGGKDVDKVITALNTYEVAYLRDMFRESVLIFQGLSQQNVEMVFKGNICSLPDSEGSKQKYVVLRGAF